MSTTTSNDCNDGASKSNDDGVCEMNDMLQNMSTTDNSDKDSGISNTCANCGKEGSDVNNTCNKCKMVKYCNAACKKKHRHNHKKECEEHLKHAAKLHDEKLFKQQPLPYGDCPICLLLMPSLSTGCKYKSCCGKVICSGCIHAVRTMENDLALCPFCRTPTSTSDEETLKRLKKRIDAGDAEAMSNMGSYYYFGRGGFAQDYGKALEYWCQAAEHGHTLAHFNIGTIYESGRGVEIDMKKAKHYYELAAIQGDVDARNALGIMEGRSGNMDRATKHFMIAAGGGYKNSLKVIQQIYSNGDATKNDYTSALQAYQAYLGEIKSVQRDEAAATGEEYLYY